MKTIALLFLFALSCNPPKDDDKICYEVLNTGEIMIVPCIGGRE
jgi:hypothetical protein